jgi:hypothetical protein
MIAGSRSSASFRDPCGFVFERGGQLYRQVNRAGREDYDRLIGSGLYEGLAATGLLVAHEEVDAEPDFPDSAYKVLLPERVPFVSYPYEWCFGQLRDAALLTLELQRRAIASGMSLKDASAYNVQFRGAKPVFIDTLSFEVYREGEPWAAYRQFCQHFLAPLALYGVDPRLNGLLRSNLDGVPLDLAARILPRRSMLLGGLLMHLYLHARLQGTHADTRDVSSTPPRRGFGRSAMLGLIESLAGTVRGLHAPKAGAGWASYTSDNTYTEAGAAEKRRLVAEFLDRADPASVWDLGANTGEYSRIAAARGANTIAFDLDPACVERNYSDAAARGESRLLPLVTDLANPSPASGWSHLERASLLDRGPADAVLALALIHHLAISNNVPLPEVAAFLARAGRWAIVEFVPKADPQVLRLLRSRRDIFDAYGREEFEAALLAPFEILRSEPIPDSGRVLYLLQARVSP